MYQNVQNKLVTCPYDAAHKVKESRLQLHIAKCKQNNLDKIMETCPFNATHIYTRSERDYHLLNCSDKAPLDRKLAQSLDKNNPFKGRTAVPAMSDPQPVYSEENWDEDISTGSAYIRQHTTPPDAIIEPPPLSKPSVRRNLYKGLHRRQAEAEKNNDSPQSANQPVVHRQPKEPSEMLKHQQQQNLQAVQTLGLGRGKPGTRIAANIYGKPENENGQAQTVNTSGIASSLNNLGLGRGQRPTQNVVPLLDDDEFPALGCGRGAFKAGQNSKSPGTKRRN